MTAQVEIDGDSFLISCPVFDNERAKGIPQRKFDNALGLWVAECSNVNARYILSQYNADEIELNALVKLKELKNVERKTEIGSFPEWFKFKNPPFDVKQQEVLDFAWPLESAALFMDMGTGKTWTVINLAAARCQNKQVTGVLVIPETGQKPVWPEEFELHCPCDYTLHVHESSTKKQTERFVSSPLSGELEVLVIGIESLSNRSGISYQIAKTFLAKHGGKSICCIDESTSIANHETARTKACYELGGEAGWRYILNGTPINQGMEDLWSQFRFMDWRIIGQKSFYTFSARYCSMGGFERRKIVGYKHIDELMSLVRPYTFLVKITDMIDMPKQTWEQRTCELNPEQKRLIKDLGDPFDMTTVMDGMILDAETVLERMTRYQQIVGGFFPHDTDEEGEQLVDWKDRKIHKVTPISGNNPKLELLKNEIKKLPLDWKVLIYARFRPEQELIAETLGAACLHYGKSQSGKPTQSTEERIEMKARFRDDDSIRFMVTGKTGYKGLNLPFVTVTFYFSNSFSYNDRGQSERRTWRKGQDNPVLYVDLTMNHKIDKQILQALKYKQSVAQFVQERLE